MVATSQALVVKLSVQQIISSVTTHAVSLKVGFVMVRIIVSLFFLVNKTKICIKATTTAVITPMKITNDMLVELLTMSVQVDNGPVPTLPIDAFQ